MTMMVSLRVCIRIMVMVSVEERFRKGNSFSKAYDLKQSIIKDMSIKME